MLHIEEVNIYSIDKGDESWAIEGEILFEDDITAPFEASYLVDEDELESLSVELDMDETFNRSALKEWIVKSASEYEE